MAATLELRTYGYTPSVLAPCMSGEVVTKHDVNELTHASRILWVGGAGDVAAIMVDGTALTLVAVPAGSALPICVKQVKSTGTTATNMVALY